MIFCFHSSNIKSIISNMSTHTSVFQFEEISNTPLLLLLFEVLCMSTHWGPIAGEIILLLQY